jgi:hypothetical protein
MPSPILQSLFTVLPDFSAAPANPDKITSVRYLRIVVTGLSRDKSTESHYHYRDRQNLSRHEACEEKRQLSRES